MANSDYPDASGCGPEVSGPPCCLQLEGVSVPKLEAGQNRAVGTVNFTFCPESGGCVQCLTFYVHSSHPDILAPQPVVHVSKKDTQASFDISITSPREKAYVLVQVLIGGGEHLPQIIRTEVIVPPSK